MTRSGELDFVADKTALCCAEAAQSAARV